MHFTSAGFHSILGGGWGQPCQEGGAAAAARSALIPLQWAKRFFMRPFSTFLVNFEEDIKMNQTRGRQGQANEFVLLLWTQEDSGFTTGPITVTQTLKTVFYKILETRVQIPLTLFGFVSLDLGLWLWTATCQLLKLQIVSYISIHCWQEEINFYL